MHAEILTPEQVELLPLLSKFSRTFVLVGGTAVALRIGHRRSIDFDLFARKPFRNPDLARKISRTRFGIRKTYVNREGEFTFLINGVKVTFYHYPYKIECGRKILNAFRMPDLLTLAAMKAFALGQRNKWKDYVDLYFIIGKYHGVKAITEKAGQLFGAEFNAKLFRNQLSYFDDINYSEEVIYLPGRGVADKTVKKALIEFSLK